LASITLTAEELLKLMAGEDVEELRKTKERMSKLLMESWLADPNFRAGLDTKARELAHTAVEREIKQAFRYETGMYNVRTLKGWGAELMKAELKDAMKLEKGISSQVHEMVKNEFESMKGEYKVVLQSHMEKLDMRNMQALVTGLVAQSIGALLKNGTLAFNLPKGGDGS
jgi:hypothetical protein